MKENAGYMVAVLVVVLAFFAGFYIANSNWATTVPAQQKENKRIWNKPFKMEVFGPGRSEGSTGVKVYWDGNTATVVERFMSGCTGLSIVEAKYYVEGNTIHIIRELNAHGIGGNVGMNCVWPYEIKYVFYDLDKNYTFVIDR